MVEACAGFDADLASAYLENALGASVRMRFDAHLAGCPSCRRHVIELSRLINNPQEIPQTQPQPSTIFAPVGVWERLRAAVAGWFGGWDFSTSKWGWATAGAAAAVLIGAISVQTWRQQRSITSSADHAAVAGGLVGETPQPFNSSGNSVEQLTTTPFFGGSSVAQSSTDQTTQIPRPLVGPVQGGADSIATLPPGAVEMRNRQIALNSSFSISDATGPNYMRFQPATPPQPQMVAGNLTSNVPGGAMSVGFPNRAGSVAPPSAEPSAMSAETAGESAVAARINPSPSDNPMVRKSKKDNRDSKETQTRGVLDKALSFLPTRDSKDGAKLEEKEIEPDAPKLLTIRVRDKVLSYQSGMWIDSAYKPEMAWRVTKLVRDSEEYNQVLAAEPQLKEYFDRGSIIIIWKNKIYKVVNK